MTLIRTRFAPSPTGYLHIGGARTALFSWLFARQQQGQFVLRIEDTDLERSTRESVEGILEGLDWLGLSYDEGPIYQSARWDRYHEVIQQLLDDGLAYRCYMTKEELEALRAEQLERGEKPRYDGRYRDYDGPPRPGVEPVIRFKNPLDGLVVFDDLLHGRVSVANSELDDLVIARGDGTPTYNLTVVVDDWDMGMTHVIRGDDHLNNTPRQINILKALGVEPPDYAHVPMILGEDGKRLSKRHGAVSVTQYRDEGYLPEALLNYLVRLGWSDGDREIFTVDELLERFDLREVNHSAATFNPDKLRWLNEHYLRHLPEVTVGEHLRWHLERLGIDPSAGPDPAAVVRAQRERVTTLVEMAEASRFLYEPLSDYDPTAAATHLNPDSAPLLEAAAEVLRGSDSWEGKALFNYLKAMAKEHGVKVGRIGQPLRVALSGTAASPSIDALLELLGRERALERVTAAIRYARQSGDDASEAVKPPDKA